MHASALGLKHFRASGHEISATSIDPYLNVITAQTTLLSNQQTAVTLRRQQMTASVQLVEALGGSWNVSDLPSATQVAGRGR